MGLIGAALDAYADGVSAEDQIACMVWTLGAVARDYQAGTMRPAEAHRLTVQLHDQLRRIRETLDPMARLPSEIHITLDRPMEDDPGDTLEISADDSEQTTH